ncbi:pimeloyl-ACP methyl ester esterase BioH [Arenimonas sp.]|uniref:pimeloyl-ACP methyl ester esterase BioH n=1 Tax=Arenimonas sp. TaxID=1872635 RepID=UPI0039E4EA9C
MKLSIEPVGTGPALVMLHGWAMHSGLFAPLSALLAASHTVHLVDLPGHGHSRDSAVPLALDAVAEAVAERVPRALWLGWSLGGLVALHAAQRRPAAVRGLIMLGANPRFVRSEAWPQGMPATIFEGFARDLESDYRATLDRFMMLEAQGSDRMREELRLLRDQVFARGEPPRQSLCDGLELLQATDLRAGLAELSMPSLWIAGRRDRLVSPASMRAAAEVAPNSRFVEIAHGGHAPFLTHAEEVVQAIREFVEQECPA